MTNRATSWGQLPDWFDQKTQDGANDQDWDQRFGQGNWRETEEPPQSMVIFIQNHTSFGMKVADIGCGNGRATLLLAKNGCNVVAMDRCKIGVDRTNQRLEEVGLSAEVVEANFYDIPLTFDRSECQAVIASQVLQLPGCWAKIKEVWNYISFIMEVGAHLYLRVRSVNNPVNPRNQLIDVYEDDEFKITQIGTNVQNRNGQVRHNYTIEEIRFLAQEYGFEIMGMITEESNEPSGGDCTPRGRNVLQWVAVLKKVRDVGIRRD
ncbi:MAG: hypothetical protein ACD_58C00325G0006 [uncultured bacterium]|nr:MAG: hypothetical protein ACD_58C00325G0006 [uncultured bacterium]